jgi:hypothetical protein
LGAGDRCNRSSAARFESGLAALPWLKWTRALALSTREKDFSSSRRAPRCVQVGVDGFHLRRLKPSRGRSKNYISAKRNLTQRENIHDAHTRVMEFTAMQVSPLRIG